LIFRWLASKLTAEEDGIFMLNRHTERGGILGIENEEVVAQLERILEHPAFRSSPRSAHFLRYIVAYWLKEENHGEPLKERTLGTTLYGLDPAYDTNQNTVVRNAAVDVRKRLTMYYLEPKHEDEIRITLPVGSYLPQIDHPTQTNHEAKTATEESGIGRVEESGTQTELISGVPKLRSNRVRSRKLAFLWALVLAASAIGAIFGIFAWQHRQSALDSKGDLSSLNLFWQPVLDATSPEGVIICVGQSPQAVDGDQVMPIGNGLAVAEITRFFALRGEAFRIEMANSVTAEQLQSSTVILIGGLDNPWTSFVTEPLRFRLTAQAGTTSRETAWIEDRKNPGKRDWFISVASPASGDMSDYAILARFKDVKTGQWRVVISGLNGVGTDAASRILAVPNNMRELIDHLPTGWAFKNLEAVFKVRTIDGKVGFPQFVTYEIW
jgi:hypothetical protein